MHSLRILTLFLSFSVCVLAFAQQDSIQRGAEAEQDVSALSYEGRVGWDDFVERYAELSGENQTDYTVDEELITDLYEIYCHPLNLNDLDEQQLRSLPFLNETAVLDILTYVESHRPLLSMGELMTLPTLDFQTRRLLTLFCRVGEMPKSRASVGQTLRQADHDLVLRTDFPFYTRLGYASYSNSYLQEHPNKIYRGTSPYYSLRYSLTVSRHVEAGLVMEKDPGEKGVDYWGAYAVLNDLGRLRTLALGNYRASFGYGLVMNTSFGFGKLMTLSTLDHMDRGLHRHSSMSESGYLRGAGATVQLMRGVQMSAFASAASVDGTLRSDSLGVSSLKTDGLHRTLLEKSKKGNLLKQDYGVNVNAQFSRLRFSATAVYTHFSRPLQPNVSTAASRYRLYNAHGSSFSNFGLAYRYIGHHWTLGGETAVGQGGGVASLLMAQGEVGQTQLTLIGRHYQARYVSINGNSFSENSRTQNESGIYVGANHRFSKRLQLEGFLDVMHFPWMKYQVSSPSWGVDAFLQANYTKGQHAVQLRWRMKTKQRDVKNTSDDTRTLVFNTVHSLRLQHVVTLPSNISLHTALLGALAHRADIGSKLGYGLSERVGWGKSLCHPLLSRTTKNSSSSLSTKLRDAQWRVALSMIIFHTDDYAARLYAYEPSLHYTFGVRSFSGEGVRGILLVQIPLLTGLDFVARATTVHYFDRDVIGTGLDQTLQNHREDVQLQLRWRF